MPRDPDCQEVHVRKSVKKKHNYICLKCGEGFDTYDINCESCGGEDTIADTPDDEDEEQENGRRRQRAKKVINISTNIPPMMSTGRKAWDIVLGGGLVRPSSVLVPGPKGVGKSTSLLAIADFIGQTFRKPVLYGSAEMPKEHLKVVCERLKLKMNYLYVNDSRHAEDMYEDIEDLKPIVIIWDSIQRFRIDQNIGQIELRNVVQGAIEAGEHVKAATILISHVTKQNDFMGENGIGHDVDVVLELKKAGRNAVSVECLEKNRFAVTPLRAIEKLYEHLPLELDETPKRKGHPLRE